MTTKKKPCEIVLNFFTDEGMAIPKGKTCMRYIEPYTGFFTEYDIPTNSCKECIDEFDIHSCHAHVLNGGHIPC